MKEWLKKNIILLLVLAVGIVAAAGILLQRGTLESRAKNYDLVADYSDYREMANQSEKSMSEWISLLAEQGVTKIGLYETNAGALSDEPGSTVSVSLEQDITAVSDWRSYYPAELTAYIEQSTHYTDALITVSNAADYQWIADAFTQRASGIKMKTVHGDGCDYIWIYGVGGGLTGEEWMDFPLGLWPAQVEMIEAAGCTVIPRTSTIEGQNGVKFAKAVLEEFRDYDAPYFMNSGDGILGFDDPEEGAELLADYLKDTGAAFAVTEEMTEQGNVSWDGDAAFLEKINYQSVRVFNEWNYIQCRYKYYNYDGPEEIANSLYRAIYERNCHVVYFKAILKEKMKDTELVGNYITEPKEYKKLLEDLYSHMDSCGYTYQTVTAMKAYEPPMLLRLFVGAGCAAAAVLLLELLLALHRRSRWVLLIAAVLCVMAVLVAMPNTSKILLSIGGGSVMPCIALAGMLRYIRVTAGKNGKALSSGGVLGSALLGTLGMTAISFCSAMFTAAALSESKYMLEIQLYRGVKVMQLIPLMIFFISFLQVFVLEKHAYGWDLPRTSLFEEKGIRLQKKERWNRFLDKPIRFREIFYALLMCAVLGVMGLMGVYYIIRTGNMSNDSIPTMELQFRNFMENHLLARPRTKEFLIGYPCMMLMLWSFRRNLPALPFLFGCGAVIGMTSIVNTFLHIRTPLQLSLIRVGTGLCFGLVIGIIAVLVCEFLYRILVRKLTSGTKNEA